MLETIILGEEKGLQISLCNLGAMWFSCQIPVANKRREILLAHQNPITSLSNGSYLGVTVGRYAGRIKNGKYRHKGIIHQVNINEPPNCLHGGWKNLSRKYWKVIKKEPKRVVFSLFSADGEEGFVGNLNIQTTYELIDEYTLMIAWQAESDRETVVNLTNHAYFNLNGDPKNPNNLSGINQYLQIDANYFIPVNTQGIPIAKKQQVDNTGMDFRQNKIIQRDLLKDETQQSVAGYDHSFLVNQHTHTQAILSSQSQDLHLSIQTTQPAIHIYSGQYLAGTPNRYGEYYGKYAGIAIETQAPPDSPNQRYHLVRVNPEKKYYHHTYYRFSS